jgi:hypothetical protein
MNDFGPKQSMNLRARTSRWAQFVALTVACLGTGSVGQAKQVDPFVKVEKGGQLTYRAGERGDRVPDFSHAGFGGGGVPLPDGTIRLVLMPIAGDNGAQIQAAIDAVASMPADAAGLRGVVLLGPGRFEVAGQIRLTASGVTLRGSGAGDGGTTIVATGTDRRALILVRGKPTTRSVPATAIADAYVPVGATSFRIKGEMPTATGQQVTVVRPATAEWLAATGMDVAPGRQQFAWKPAAMTLSWTRTVVAIEGDRITLDAPLTTAIDDKFGGGKVGAAESGERLIGVENLRLESVFDPANPLDEQHAWDAISIDQVRDAWVADVTAVHFAGSAVNIGPGASRVTVQDCASLAPVSELGGYRRHTFTTAGEQTLFLRCRAEDGRNDFTAGYKAGGPNVFLECSALRSHGFSGSVGSWASGLLFDNVTLDGGTLELNNRETWNQGVGWAAVNSMLWQCSAPVVINRMPPTAQNWADGVWGQFVGDGWWSRVNEFVHPDSLYRAQLASRLGEKSVAVLAARKYPGVDPKMEPWTAPTKRVADSAAIKEKRLSNQNGVLMIGDAPLTGREAEISWWRGYMYEGGEPTNPMLTRVAPGRVGDIFTDDLSRVVGTMVNAGQSVLRHHYGLWYDRRRMDHERMRRPDGDVWPPFYEQPFARSGQGSAWDGLSRYDLTKYNPWYFGRLREFAWWARLKGVVLINEMYFQHNIIEAGAHWVDSPWRPVNNINGTKFTEPPPFTGDTIKMADEFYNLSDPAYRALHRTYIRQCLANLADEPNVIHTLSAENSGPLHFMQFWLDVVAEWEKETGRHPLIALSACKDVQDAILADPVRSAVVDVIDLTYWFRTAKGEEFAPKGGQSLAPRQHLRLWKGGRPSASSIRAMAAEYRAKYPGKAVITGLGEADSVQPR